VGLKSRQIKIGEDVGISLRKRVFFFKVGLDGWTGLRERDAVSKWPETPAASSSLLSSFGGRESRARKSGGEDGSGDGGTLRIFVRSEGGLKPRISTVHHPLLGLTFLSTDWKLQDRQNLVGEMGKGNGHSGEHAPGMPDFPFQHNSPLSFPKDWNGKQKKL